MGQNFWYTKKGVKKGAWVRKTTRRKQWLFEKIFIYPSSFMRDPNGIGSREFLLKCSNSILIESNSIFSKVQSTIFLVIDTELLIRLGENSGMNIFQTFSYRLDAKNLQMYWNFSVRSNPRCLSKVCIWTNERSAGSVLCSHWSRHKL